jgi:hypothetical protein
MKKLLASVLIAGLLGSPLHAVMQYQPEPSAAQSSGGRSNIVPVVAITSAVLAVGYTIFKVKKAKTARAARFNVFVQNQEVK